MFVYSLEGDWNVDPLLYYPFDTDYNSEGCEPAVTFVTLGGMMSLSPLGKKGKAAYFGGNGRLEVPYLSNLFSDNDIKALTVAGWFYSFGVSGGYAGLVGNGGCEGMTAPFSFELYLDNLGNTNAFLLTDTWLTTDVSPVSNLT